MIVKINNFFKKEATHLDYKSVLSAINPLETKMTFAVYDDQVKKYLYEMEDKING